VLGCSYAFAMLTEPLRVLTKGMSADVEITLRVSGMSDPNAKARPLPLETFSTNKDMGRVLIRRGGETIAAGMF
jgi:elongation factor 1 alpha-like protein